MKKNESPDSRNKENIDILVEIKSNISLLDFVGLKLELEEVLGRKVDLGTNIMMSLGKK